MGPKSTTTPPEFLILGGRPTFFFGGGGASFSESRGFFRGRPTPRFMPSTASFILGRPRLRFVWEGNSLLEDEDANGLLLPSELLSKLDELWIIQNSPKRVEETPC
jgi:hypothetical protein